MLSRSARASARAPSARSAPSPMGFVARPRRATSDSRPTSPTAWAVAAPDHRPGYSDVLRSGAAWRCATRCVQKRLGVELASISVEIEADFDVVGMLSMEATARPGYSEVRYHVRVESSAAEADTSPGARRGRPPQSISRRVLGRDADEANRLDRSATGLTSSCHCNTGRTVRVGLGPRVLRRIDAGSYGRLRWRGSHPRRGSGRR